MKHTTSLGEGESERRKGQRKEGKESEGGRKEGRMDTQMDKYGTL